MSTGTRFGSTDIASVLNHKVDSNGELHFECQVVTANGWDTLWLEAKTQIYPNTLSRCSHFKKYYPKHGAESFAVFKKNEILAASDTATREYLIESTVTFNNDDTIKATIKVHENYVNKEFYSLKDGGLPLSDITKSLKKSYVFPPKQVDNVSMVYFENAEGARTVIQGEFVPASMIEWQPSVKNGDGKKNKKKVTKPYKHGKINKIVMFDKNYAVTHGFLDETKEKDASKVAEAEKEERDKNQNRRKAPTLTPTKLSQPRLNVAEAVDFLTDNNDNNEKSTQYLGAKDSPRSKESGSESNLSFISQASQQNSGNSDFEPSADGDVQRLQDELEESKTKCEIYKDKYEKARQDASYYKQKYYELKEYQKRERQWRERDRRDRDRDDYRRYGSSRSKYERSISPSYSPRRSRRTQRRRRSYSQSPDERSRDRRSRRHRTPPSPAHKTQTSRKPKNEANTRKNVNENGDIELLPYDSKSIHKLIRVHADWRIAKEKGINVGAISLKEDKENKLPAACKNSSDLLTSKKAIKYCDVQRIRIKKSEKDMSLNAFARKYFAEGVTYTSATRSQSMSDRYTPPEDLVVD